jgi:hypothetical protein
VSFNFPNSPTNGQLYTPAGGTQYVYLDGVWRVVEAPQNTASVILTDGITAPATVAGKVQIYVDSADGDLKVKFGDGVVKTISVDT